MHQIQVQVQLQASKFYQFVVAALVGKLLSITLKTDWASSLVSRCKPFWFDTLAYIFPEWWGGECVSVRRRGVCVPKGIDDYATAMFCALFIKGCF